MNTTTYEPDTEAADKLGKARTDMVLYMPFFASLVLRLYYKQADLPTAGVDGINFFYNPKFVKDLNHKQLIFLMMHESLHCALGHMTRQQERDQKKFNVACDYVINLMIQDYNIEQQRRTLLEFPDGALIDTKYAGLSSEEVYAVLEDPSDEDMEAGQWGAVMPAPSPGDTENNPAQMSESELAQEWKVATKQAVKAAKMAGKMPGDMAELLDEMLAPKVRWQDKLRRFMTSHDRSGFSWSRVNKRYIAHGFILPSRWASAIGEIVVAIDTSCSVSTEELKQFQAEINQILTDSAPKKVTVIGCDTKINKVDSYDKSNLPLKLEVVGRGGTRFEPVFEYVKDKNIKPECLLYMTDLGASSDFMPPPYPVMWVNTDPNEQHPSWGEVVDLVLN